MFVVLVRLDVTFVGLSEVLMKSMWNDVVRISQGDNTKALLSIIYLHLHSQQLILSAVLRLSVTTF